MLTINDVINTVLQYRPNANVELIRKAYIFQGNLTVLRKEKKEYLIFIIHSQ